ncbi:MAG TPA: hypothetical protein VIZ65_09865 [Cellvibrionaceae bacterium]
MLKRLSSWFSGRKLEEKTQQLCALPWTHEESELILWNEAQRGLGRIELAGRSGLFHAALLGVDILENQLLIDVPFPSPPVDLLLPGAVCKISFSKHQQLLQLQVRVEQRLIFEGRTALLVQIIERDFHYDRRAGERITFARGEWPLMCMQIPMAEQLRARIINLSSGGALVNIFGKHDTIVSPKALVGMKLQLTDSCCIDVKCAIKSISYYRRPCQHTQFRVQFMAMSESDQRKLDLFIAYEQDRRVQNSRALTVLDAG